MENLIEEYVQKIEPIDIYATSKDLRRDYVNRFSLPLVNSLVESR